LGGAGYLTKKNQARSVSDQDKKINPKSYFVFFGLSHLGLSCVFSCCFLLYYLIYCFMHNTRNLSILIAFVVALLPALQNLLSDWIISFPNEFSLYFFKHFFWVPLFNMRIFHRFIAETLFNCLDIKWYALSDCMLI